MVFSSLVFLCIFLPVVLVLHTLIPNRKVKNGLLIAASLLFYAYGEPVYVFLMLAEALVNYGFGLLIERQHKRWLLAVAVVLNVGVLAFFKYTGFLLGNINALFSASIPMPEIALPIGISFYTFQALSYVIDVYRGEVKAQKNYAKVLLYISLFPQLIAGPIVRYQDIEREIDERTVTLPEIALGLRRFLFGLGKKVLIANTMAVAADAVFTLDIAQVNGISAWTGAIAYALQIYFDFSGYSDMAIGLGQMMGFHFKENFNDPYTAVTVQDFWRRWHISLSSWFRDYVYIPLGGNRKGKERTIVNRIIVFFLTGLWHGANWTFVVWGLFHGCFLLLEEAVPQIKKLPRALLHLYTLLVVVLGFVIFRADTLGQGLRFIGAMFSSPQGTAAAMSLAMQRLTPSFLTMLIVGVFACGPHAWVKNKLASVLNGERFRALRLYAHAATFVCAWLILVWCVFRLAGSSYNPFIYFRF